MEVFEGAIGIDLGTTYSCVAVWLNDRAEIIANDQGSRLTPSCVAFQGDEVLVGNSAHTLLARGARNVVYDAKRMIGRRWSDATFQQDRTRWPFEVIEGDGNQVRIRVEHKQEVVELAPEEISARLLAYLKSMAERYLGKTVVRAVITVPAYFSDAQRERTKAAATIAGLDVLRLVNEPTAAALCYGLANASTSTTTTTNNNNNSASGDNDDDAGAHNIVVFDVGGGTFDVSVLTIAFGCFSVRATAGDTHLGGQDIDARLLDYVAADLKKRHGTDISANPRMLARARAACERVKRVLTHATSDELALEGILPDGEEYVCSISRAKLEELAAPLLEKCFKVLAGALKDAKMATDEVHEVVLVGGSSRIPAIHARMAALFGVNQDGGSSRGRRCATRICCSVHPDEAVAIGAAVQASILSNDPAQQSSATAAVVLMDVVPLSIGVEVDDGKMDVLIKRNTNIPYRIVKEYSTVVDHQDAVDIEIYEGERPLTKHNHKLGSFSLEGIARAKKGVPTIDVCFSVDADGLLTVSAEERSSSSTGKKSLVVRSTDRLSHEEVEHMTNTAKRFATEDAAELAVHEATTQVMAALAQVRASLAQLPQTSMTMPHVQKRLAVVEHAEKWMKESLPTYSQDAMAAKVAKIVRVLGNVDRKLRREVKNSSRRKRRRDSDDDDDDDDKSSSDEDDGGDDDSD